MLRKTKLLTLVLTLVFAQFINAAPITTPQQTTASEQICNIILIVQGLAESETHTLEKEVLMIKVVDSNGEIITEIQPTGEVVTIDLTGQSKGIYEITITYSEYPEQIITFVN